MRVRLPAAYGPDEPLQVWACEACAPRQRGLVLLSPHQKRTLDRVRGEQGCVADREVASWPASSQSSSKGDSSRLGVEQLAAWHLLSSVRGVGPKATAAIHAAGLTPAQLIENPDLYPLKGKRATGVVTAMRALTDSERASANKFAQSQLQRARELHTTIISYDDDDYPPLVRDSNNPIPYPLGAWQQVNSSVDEDSRLRWLTKNQEPLPPNFKRRLLMLQCKKASSSLQGSQWEQTVSATDGRLREEALLSV